MRTYEQKQLYNRKELEKRYADAYEKLPELKVLHDAISELSVGQARKLLEGDENALAQLKLQIKDLSDEGNALLATGGFPADYLEMHYECADCKDTGYIGNEKCHCFQNMIIDMLYEQSNLKHVLQRENFDTFSFSYYSPNYIDPETGYSSLATIQNAYEEARSFVDTFGKDFRNLFFYGDPGVGKTFLSNCIAKELIDQSNSVVYLSSYQLFDTLAKGRFDKDEMSERINRHLFNCDLLIIDDLGTELVNSLTVSQLFLCLNERLLNRKPTIISTNLSLDALVEIYSERIFSRITSNYTMLKLTGDDIRIKKKLMNMEEM
jgi:DNA replication protein DnaC